MRLIIHDLTPAQEQALLPRDEDTRIISDGGGIRPCIGCFGCWVKTPAQCVIRDKYGDMGAQLGHTSELILISRCTYGGFSPFVKNVLDRSISYIHPYFKVRNGEMHHKPRYSDSLAMRVYFYGEEISEQERALARRLVNANAVNLYGTVKEIAFAESPEEFGGRIAGRSSL
jgi:multimeric flavodoxin WrbA